MAAILLDGGHGFLFSQEGANLIQLLLNVIDPFLDLFRTLFFRA